MIGTIRLRSLGLLNYILMSVTTPSSIGHTMTLTAVIATCAYLLY